MGVGGKESLWRRKKKETKVRHSFANGTFGYGGKGAFKVEEEETASFL